MKKTQKGITLVALIITIIVLLILAVVAIRTVQGDGILNYGKKATFLSEVGEIKEQISLKVLGEPDKNKYKFGTLADIIGRTDEYNEILCMENGSLAYDDKKANEKQKVWLQEVGIFAKKNIIPIYTKDQFAMISSGLTDKINGVEYEFTTSATYYIQNDIDFEGSAESPNTAISTFKGTLDGQNYTLSNIYISGTGFQGLFTNNYGLIQNIRLKDTYVQGDFAAGTITPSNSGNVRNIIFNNVKVSSYWQRTGLAVGINNGNGVVSECSVEEYSTSCLASIVGTNQSDGVIGGCYNTCSTGVTYDAGRIASTNHGIIASCWNSGNVTSIRNISGIVTKNSATGVIINCFNKGNITCSQYGASGIVVENEGLIIGCYNSRTSIW